MTLMRGLRLAGTGVRNGHPRLLQNSPGIRHYSLATQSISSRISSSRAHYPRASHISVQSRSISLFGWGSSAKPQSPDLTISEPSSKLAQDPILTDTTGPTRIVKASRDTAEGYDSSQLQSHPPTSFEPESVENLQQSITAPHGTDGNPLSAIDLANEPERLGYLKEVCGLDFGWGPTSSMEWVLEHLHLTAGFSWTVAIITMAFGIRTALVPALIISAKQQAKMREAQPVLAPLRQQYKDAVLVKDQMKAQQISAEIRAISKEFDISIWKAFVPFMIQLPFGFGAWRLLRTAGSLPVPGFVTETWLWTSDLSFSDPYLITPALSSAFIYLTFRSNMNAQSASVNMNFMKLMSNVFPALSFVFMLFQPGAVQLYFMTSTFAGLITAQVMRNKAWRAFFKLGPLPGSPEAAAAAATATTAAAATAVTASASSSVVSSVKPTPGAGGLNRRATFYVPPKPAPVEAATAAAASSDRSVIDRGVDSVKSGWTDMKKSAQGLSSDVWGSMEKRQATDRRAKLDRYEEQERHREDELRKARNARLDEEESQTGRSPRGGRR